MAKYPSIVRDLAHYLYSCPGAVKYGLYGKPLEVMAAEFGRTQAQLKGALEVLGKLEYAHFDEATSFVWVPKMAFWQLKPLPLKVRDHNIKAARQWYRELPRNPYIGEFFDRYDFDLRLSDADVWPGTEVGRREWSTAPATLLDEAMAVESQALAIAEPAPPAKERRASMDLRQLEADFETWWKVYPKKSGKLAARTEWMKHQPTRDTPIEKLLEKLAEQCRSFDWTKDGGKWIVDPERYIKRGRWLDEVRKIRAPLARQNEGTLNTLMDMAEEDLGAEGFTELSQRAGSGGGRDED